MAGSSPKESALSFEAARHIVEQQVSALPPVALERLSLHQAFDRVLAQDIVADRDLPPFPRSARDGYAVRSPDLTSVPAKLDVVGEVRAGSLPAFSISAQQAAEIMTGAPVPAGADAVVMVENTRAEKGIVEIFRTASAGDNIVPAASEARRGDVLL
ncbi:MAG: molybdopterin molybdenumtransferase MoeA, partial [Candidatus Korobacteraceae bacterium]